MHFTRKFNLAIQSRFPDFRINAFSPLLIHSRRFLSAPQIQFSSFVQWDLERSLLCYSDRIVQDSHLIPSSGRISPASTSYVLYGIILCLYYHCLPAMSNPKDPEPQRLRIRQILIRNIRTGSAAAYVRNPDLQYRISLYLPCQWRWSATDIRPDIRSRDRPVRCRG